MEKKTFGYVRVSSKDQNEIRQVESLLNEGIDQRDIFIDKQSGKNFEREQYQILKKVMRRGDTLFVHSLDRFGRNKEQILEEWRELTKEKGIDIVVVDMPLLDTRKYKDSMGSLITDIVLQLLSWLAEEERNKIRKRQREGIDIALKNGVRFGRQPAQITPEFEAAYKKWRAGEIKAIEAMKEANLKKATFYKLVKKYESKDIH